MPINVYFFQKSVSSELNLGEDCSRNDACGTENSFCGESGKCECSQGFYDNNGDDVNGGLCLFSKSGYLLCCFPDSLISDINNTI